MGWRNSTLLAFTTLYNKFCKKRSLGTPCLDGHTASLFPHQTILIKTDKWIRLTETGYDDRVNQRMSMTLNLPSNKAKGIAVLVVGNQKQNVVKNISSGEVDIWNYPVTGIHPDTGDMTW